MIVLTGLLKPYPFDFVADHHFQEVVNKEMTNLWD